ncbi:DUF4055 domain-containing protein [Sinorhizobium medicae]|uniref:DUF4055 domain-containing protein n=1 Tax=Sinorhizobium medicae TaxID=110321 RepID=UPI002AF6C732|nr:DUF4055 domain-containing protein [Sinorhizobium medicae]WQO60070.1 DUF4055 domain-containing protein [Sinorhizobium medicae]
MRDVTQGHKAIQAAGVKYLPKLGDQSDAEYDAYKKRATFFNATGRVKDALTGMVFRKEAKLEHQDAFKPIIQDMTLTGTPFEQFAENIVEELMDVNRVGVLVDYPNVGAVASGKVVTLDVADKLGIRVYASIYKAEDIINWRTTQVGGKSVLSLVVLRECTEVIDPADMFCVTKKIQYRVLELIGGVYKQSVWVENSNGTRVTSWTLALEVMPTKGGKPMDAIPFEFFSSEGGEPCVHDPVLYDLAVVNLAHYRNTADMEHGLHFTGLPTAVISGVSADDDDSYRIGSVTAWVFSDAQAKATYLEFKGEGLGQLRNAIQDKEAQMAALGARMLAPEKRDAEAADTIAQKRQGENSSLAALVNSVSRGLTRVLTIMAGWQGAGDAVTVKLNTDFLAVSMPPQQITALLQAVMSGNLSPQSFYESLVKGEVVSGARDYEAEKALIDEAGAAQSVAVTDEA